MAAKKGKGDLPKYIVISRTGTNPLSVAVESAIEEGLSISAYVRQKYRKHNPEKVLEFAKK